VSISPVVNKLRVGMVSKIGALKREMGAEATHSMSDIRGSGQRQRDILQHKLTQLFRVKIVIHYLKKDSTLPLCQFSGWF
jgi:hypothetical protein